jgi:phage repressor protein C with HTH and peptisase S24 domain
MQLGNEHETEVSGFRSGVGNRLREVEKRFANREAAARAAGVAKSTLQSWIEGKSDPSFIGLVRLSQATDCDLNWLATGEGNMRAGQSGTTDAAPLDEKMLAAAIDLIETWLAQNRRKMEPAKKAQVIVMAYEILTESGDSEIRESDRNNVIRLLRVAS